MAITYQSGIIASSTSQEGYSSNSATGKKQLFRETGALHKGCGISSAIGKKRLSRETGIPLPSSKRPCSASLTEDDNVAIPNRVHRCVIVRDYGNPIYKASSLPIVFTAFEGCIEGHESLRKAGILHRDISINNVMINEGNDKSSWTGFLIDLDLAIKEERNCASGARKKTGTCVFVAIGVLLGEQNSSMHDLESFFWVLFWICTHYNGPGEEDEKETSLDAWNYEDAKTPAGRKMGVVIDDDYFRGFQDDHFNTCYQPLIPYALISCGERCSQTVGGRRARSRNSIRQ